ncbi:MAG: biphenyl 2,3-dioxygenase, partial [Leptolyngbyaceae cyanobacterium RM2_2_21]|nr:biphenyl 2,3-dioxygenase [Leptolyngbyaceae cyanobacterium RM2_2_21]
MDNAVAAGIMRQEPVQVHVSLGNTANELKFEPDHLTFASGQRYQMVLKNPSSQKHYFTAKDFADNL